MFLSPLRHHIDFHRIGFRIERVFRPIGDVLIFVLGRDLVRVMTVTEPSSSCSGIGVLKLTPSSTCQRPTSFFHGLGGGFQLEWSA